MAIKNTALGGTDWADEEVVTHTDINDTFDATVIKRKVFSNLTETTTASTSYTSGRSFTFGALNSVVLSVSIRCQLHNDATYFTRCQGRFVGTNLGTKYLTNQELVSDSGVNTFLPVVDDAFDLYIFSESNASYDKHGLTCAPALKLLDASTTFHLDFRTTNAAGTAYLDEVEIEIVYATFADE